jgi:glycosyltransferase involved in cell wall biosynthesis
MLVSVVIPCFNQGRYLDDALSSILDQSYTDWECIIVDDGSTDETKSVCLRWQEKDSRFMYVYKKNGGLSSARNCGLFYCKGDFIQFLDADDIILKDKFEIQIKSIMNTSGCDISLCDYMPSDEHDLTKPYGNARYLKPFLEDNDYLKEFIINWEVSLSIPCHCFLFRSAFFLKRGIRFDETLPNHEDWDCWMQIFALKPVAIQIHKVLAVYRIRSAAMSYDADRMTKGFLSAINKQMKLLRNDDFYYKLLRQKYYLVLSDYKCDKQIDYLRLRLKEKYKYFRKKISAATLILKKSLNSL